MIKKRYIPKRLIYIDRDDRQTKALRNPRTGKLLGRRAVKKGERGDKTFPRRVRSGPWGGIILGRSKAIKVRGSKTARAHKRKLQIRTI